MDLYSHCSRCKGTGQDTVMVNGTPQSTPCPQCGATGFYKYGISGPEIDEIAANIKVCLEYLEKILANMKLK